MKWIKAQYVFCVYSSLACCWYKQCPNISALSMCCCIWARVQSWVIKCHQWAHSLLKIHDIGANPIDTLSIAFSLKYAYSVEYFLPYYRSINHNFNNTNWKRIDSALRIRIWGLRFVGAGSTTELSRLAKIVCGLCDPKFCYFGIEFSQEKYVSSI